MTIEGVFGYQFTLGIPFAGYIKNGILPCWIGIVTIKSIYYVYGFNASNIDGGKMTCSKFNIISDMDATIFYI